VFQFLNKWWLKGPNTHFHISIWTLTPMCGLDLGHRDLNFARDTPPYICAKLYWNPTMYVEVLLRTSVFQWPLIWPWPLTKRPDSCAWHSFFLWWTFLWRFNKIPQGVNKICCGQKLDAPTPTAHLPARGKTFIKRAYKKYIKAVDATFEIISE
jgi:hypothetical protein